MIWKKDFSKCSLDLIKLKWISFQAIFMSTTFRSICKSFSKHKDENRYTYIVLLFLYREDFTENLKKYLILLITINLVEGLFFHLNFSLESIYTLQ